MHEVSSAHYSQQIGVKVEKSRPGVESDGELPLSPGLCSPEAIRVGVIGLFLQQTCGHVVTGDGSVGVVSNLGVSIMRSGLKAGNLRSKGRLIRRGRGAVLVEAWIWGEDQDEPLAYGVTRWAPVPEGRVVGTSGHDESSPVLIDPEEDILSLIGFTYEDSIVRLTGVRPSIAHIDARSVQLHGGVLQLMAEEAARRSTLKSTGWEGCRVTATNIQFLNAGRAGPFIATAEPIAYTDAEGVWRVEIREGEPGNVPILLATAQMVRA